MEERRETLSDFVAGSVPTVYYVPDFITDAEQHQLLTNIYQAPISKWKAVKNRRLQNWGGVVHEKGLLAQDLPPWLTRITRRISKESTLFPSPINHVLINEYLPDQGIMPHQDGPAYFPVVAIVSLGSPVVMDFTPHSSLTVSSNELRNNLEDKVSNGGDPEIENDTVLENHKPFSVALMPRSLLIFKDRAYSDYLHGIKDCPVQQYDGAVNASEIRKHHGVSQSTPDSGKSNEVTTEDFTSIHRTTKRISLTCRVVSKGNNHAGYDLGTDDEDVDFDFDDDIYLDIPLSPTEDAGPSHSAGPSYSTCPSYSTGPSFSTTAPTSAAPHTFAGLQASIQELRTNQTAMQATQQEMMTMLEAMQATQQEMMTMLQQMHQWHISQGHFGPPP